MAEPLPDFLAPGLRVVFCGINPGLTSMRCGFAFSHPSNRFWLVLHLAGFTPQRLAPENGRALLQHGCGLTAAVTRATAGAAELSRSELRAAIAPLERKMLEYRPRTIAFLGKAVYSTIAPQKPLAWGLQPTAFAGCRAWVLPNPSGLNRAFPLADLVSAYRELRLGAFEGSGESRSIRAAAQERAIG